MNTIVFSIFNEYAKSNKWLLSFTEAERRVIMEMISKAYEEGVEEGM